MSNSPQNPNEPKGPWLYSGAPQPTPAYTPPPTPPTPKPTPASQPPAPSTPAEQNTAHPAAVTIPAAKPIENQKSKIENPPNDASLASIVDTIEAIIIALILALTFRAFIIEAFVIPTGSMAPTLLGAHFNVICPQCGYAFKRDASLHYQQISANGRSILHYFGSRGELSSNTAIPCDGDETSSLMCPNCQYVIPWDKLPQYLDTRIIDDPRNQTKDRPIPFAWANNGDRILVLKYLYSILDPTRFDVIVFKEPMKAQDNYIKRLIGLPGETVEAIAGDIFIGPPGKTAPEDRLIARKPPHVQEDLWQNVYDNDHPPRDEGDLRLDAQRDDQLRPLFAHWHNPWIGAGPTADGWNKKNAKSPVGIPLTTVGGPVIHYAANAPGTLQFNPLHKGSYAANILGYNNDIHEIYGIKDFTRTLRPVGDLRVETTWTPSDSAGESVALSVGFKQNLFRVTWSSQGLQLARFDPAANQYNPVMAIDAARQPGPKAGTAYNIAMNNVDHSIQFFIDGKMVLEHDIPWSAKDAYAFDDTILASLPRVGNSPDESLSTLLDALAPTVEINVAGACSLGHLKVLRDLYYTQSEPGTGHFPGAATRGHPLTLGPDEFFAMGDNSRKSHDGRTWDEVFPPLDDIGTRRGIVPRRYLLGKAIFVYWPAGYRFSDKLQIWPLVPNTGDMRFIR